MAYVITFGERDTYNVRVVLSKAACANRVYCFAKANGYTVSKDVDYPRPIRTPEESAIAQEILSELVDKGLAL